MSYKPLVTIIIPLYNGSNYVEAAIQSALAQTYERIEIVVVNDGSTDNGAGKKICDRYSDRIVYFEKENGGCASALNFGIRHAHGQLISWLSHDDLYEPGKIEKQVAMYKRYNLNAENTIVSSCGALIDSEGKSIRHPGRKDTGLYSPIQAFAYILLRACPNGCGLLIPKTCFEKCGYFDEHLRFVLDWNLWLKFALKGVYYFFDDEKLVYNRVHSKQVTVQQKELHTTETDYSVDNLLGMIVEGDFDKEYLKQLYYFCSSCNYGNIKEIRRYLKENHISVNKLYDFWLKCKRQGRQLAKEIYHRIR